MRRYCLKLGVMALVALLLPLSAVQAASVDDLQVKLNAQQRTMLAQQNQLTEIQNEIASLRGAIEELRYLIKQQNSAATASATPAPATAAPDATVTTTNAVAAPAPTTPQVTASTGTTNATSATAATSSASTGPTLKPADAQAKASYDAAYAKVMANDFAGAATAFNDYVATYPDNSLTPNAWYWLGQVQYRQNNFEAARVSFLNVARFTSSAKRPDALYKLGLICKQKGDTEKAKRYFNLVINTYPADTSANMARRELGL